MIGDCFIRPIEADNPHTYQEILDSREVEAARRGKSPPISAFTNRVLYTHLPFLTIRSASLLRNRQNSTRIIYPRMEEQTDLFSCWTRYYWNAQGPRTISPLEDEIEQYVLNQWEFAICNTFFPVDDLQCQNHLEKDCRDYPEHLRYSWHLCKTPQDIYETAKKITNTCEIINYDEYKPLVNKHVTIQEVDKCVDKLLQQTSIWGNCSRIQLIALEN